MVSTYHGIETGRRANEYFKKSMEITGVNLTNMGKEGYSRQVVSKQAAPGLVTSVNISHLGTGVEITAIERMRDLFLDAQYKRATVEQVYWETMAYGIKRVETFIVNTNEKGINNLLDSFWSAMQEVHLNPQDQSIRSAFLQEADTLALFSKDLYSAYSSYRKELNTDIKSMVEDANSYIDQIAILNKAITQVRLGGGEPNQLLDQRDLLAEKLSKLTGCEVGTSRDELDGDYKISLNGRLLVQGEKTRHLMLVENPANEGYYDVQVEYNQYDVTSSPEVAEVIVEQRANSGGSCTLNGVHELEVVRTADETYWTVGHGDDRILVEHDDEPVGRDGSFALQVGSSGARLFSVGFDTGNILESLGPGEPDEYVFRIAAGDFESTITIKWNSGAWEISDNRGTLAAIATGANGALTVSDLETFINTNYDGSISASTASNGALILEGETGLTPNSEPSGHLISVSDMVGGLMRESGLANESPIVLIEVEEDDTLQTIANKINNAYKFDTTKTKDDGSYLYTTVPPGTPPSSPEEWVHASVEQDADGYYYLCITSNAAGEASRINILSGAACGVGSGEMGTAQALGLVENISGQTDAASYMQIDRANDDKVTKRDTGDVFVDDAYIIMDGRRFLSSSNDFMEARFIPNGGIAKADELEEVVTGIRVSLKGSGEIDSNGDLVPGSNITTIIVQHHLSKGEIFANLTLRDDVLLSQMDTFDDIMYKLASEFNAVHYAGFGAGGYANISGLAFFQQINNKYGAFGKLAMDEAAMQDENRLAASSGDGYGQSMGDGMNALEISRLKQAKLFMKGIADFNALYTDFVADLGAFGERAMTALETQDYIVEQVEIQRSSIMGVNSSEEMLNLVEMNNEFNKSSQYISTLFQVIDKIINGVGRVGL
jgi:flagellar hook-associated protein 1 FlgK